MTAYNKLEAIFRRHAALGGAAGILQWDNATMMPKGSSAARGEQLAALIEVAHETLTQPKIAELLAKAEGDVVSLNDWQQANLHEMKRAWQHQNAVPAQLVAALTKAGIESEMFWRTARKENDFAGFRPYLEKVVALVREVAQAKSAAMGLTPYDALIDQYDPGTRTAIIDVIFDDLAAFLPDFLGRVMEHQARRPSPLEIAGHFPAAKQKALGRLFMEKLGFDFTRGRLDESMHPFCGGAPGDVRLTTRYNEQNFLPGFFGILHETGHALYDLGLPEQWRNQPVGEARGMAFHESQSLLVEMQLALSQDFLHYAAPILREAFSASGPAWEPENIARLVTQVQPSLIRVEADEVTYPSHIILRYRLERQLIAGTLQVKDLPQAWNAGMQELLGLTSPNDADGCMQDIHWTDGSFGYFPSYTLGAMTAAQLFAAIKTAIPDLGKHIQKGEFIELFKWLKNNVHSQGSKLSSPKLLQHATGQTLNASIYKKHLENRYLNWT